ncbi:hypothetical protein D3C77_597640 [compost metagenome]
MNEVFYQVMVMTFLTVSQVFDHALTLQQLDHLSQAILQALLRLFYFDFSHRRTPLPAAEHAGRINQSDLDWQNLLLSNYWVSPWWYSTSPGGADGRNHTPLELSGC